MRSVRSSGTLIGLAVVLIAATVPLRADDDALERSRSLAQSFGARLKAELKAGLEAGGPAHAIGVCKYIAPQIASELSRKSGAKVARTSLRYRNPGNSPEPWQVAVLEDFEAQVTSKPSTAPLEHFARAEDGSIRYMMAIRTDGVCLACHGSSIPPNLKESIDEEYPHDRAVGYGLGDVRGAFSISWPSSD